MSIKQPRWRGMCVLYEYTPEEILAQRGNHHVTFTVGDFPHSINMSDSRYRVFSQSLKCCDCGIAGSVMRLEYSKHPRGLIEPHFNLYARKNDGTLVLMTQDHIIPRSKGGSDRDENLRTMCAPCNEKKGHKLLNDGSIEKIRQKRRDTLLNYLNDTIKGKKIGSRSKAEELLLAVINDDKVVVRWKLAAEKAGWEMSREQY